MIAANRISDEISTRPSIGRIVVGATGVCWLLFASKFPYSLAGFGIIVVLALLALDIVLGISTGWLAIMPTARLDERQITLRDRAYRIGFRLVGAGILVMFLLALAGYIARFYLVGPPVQSVLGGFSPRTIVALLELLVIAPTAVIAWIMPTAAEAGDDHATRWLPLLAIPVGAFLWILTIALAPTQSSTATKLPDNGSFSMGGATCGHISALKDVALGFGGAARMEATICWNGEQAYTIGDASLPRPTSFRAEEWPFVNGEPGLTSCTPLPTDTDFGSVSEHCTGRIDADGTFHLTMIGEIAPLPGGLASRDVRVDLAVTRDGKVLNFG